MLNAVPYSETELIAALREGAQSAYSYLYDHYSAALYGCILQIIPEHEQAEDVLQEVFIKIFQKIEQYDSGKGRLFTWMMQIARNMAIDKVRSKGYKNNHRVATFVTDDMDQGDHGSVTPNMDHLGMDKVLISLDKTHKQVIDLAYFKGYTQNEIAKELDIPIGTVKTRVRNALTQLRKLLNLS